MNRLLSVEAIYDGGKIKISEVNIHSQTPPLDVNLEKRGGRYLH